MLYRDNSQISLEQRDEGPPAIVGLAAPFYRAGDPGTEYRLWDNAVERLMPTAFDAALERGDDAMALFNHDKNQVLGRRSSGTLSLYKTVEGLRYRIQASNSQTYQNVVEYLSRGDVSGSSFAFTIPENGQQWRMDGDTEVREITSVQLYDVGPVVGPAYAASESGLRNDHVAEARSSYDAWKQQHDRGVKEKMRGFELDALDAETRVALYKYS